MKVLFCLFGGEGGADGVSESCRLIIKNLKCDVQIASRFCFLSESEAGGQKKILLKHLGVLLRRRYGKIGGVFGVLTDIILFMLIFARNRPDVVYAADQVTQFFAIPAARFMRIPIVSGVRGAPSNGWFWKYLLPMSNLIIPLSQDLASALPRSDLYKSKIVIIPNPVSARPLKKKLLPRNNDFLHIGYVGMFDERKNQLEAINSLFPLFRSRCKLHFYGAEKRSNGNYFEYCKSVANRIAPEDIIFYGVLCDRDQIYNSFDVLLLMSQSEGQARVLLEAVSYGVPFISYPVESAADIAAQSGIGWVTESRSPQEIASIVKNILMNGIGHKVIRNDFWISHSEQVVSRLYMEQFRNLTNE